LAVYFVVAASREEPLPPLVVAWGGLLVGATGMVVAAGVGIVPIVAPRVPVLLAQARVSWVVPVLGLGVLAGALAYVTGVIAAKALGARVASFAGLSEVVFAVVYAWILLGQRLTSTQLVGGALVVFGIALVRADPSGQPADPLPMRTRRC
jgi:drug/metabolite transporter (DMT)-like permease